MLMAIFGIPLNCANDPPFMVDDCGSWGLSSNKCRNFWDVIFDHPNMTNVFMLKNVKTGSTGIALMCAYDLLFCLD